MKTRSFSLRYIFFHRRWLTLLLLFVLFLDFHTSQKKTITIHMILVLLRYTIIKTHLRVQLQTVTIFNLFP